MIDEPLFTVEQAEGWAFNSAVALPFIVAGLAWLALF